MRVISRVLAAIAGLVAVVLVVVPDASAHERRQVGAYVVVVGFDIEPAFVEELNAALITVFRADGTPVEGVDKTLKVEVSVGGASRTFDLKPKPGRAGSYIAEFIPTKTGIYTFRFFGTIDGQQVNERFESGPGRFDEVVSKADLQFPAAVPSNGELAAQQGGGTAPSDSSAAVQEALDRADTARNLAILFGVIGIAVGAVGIGLAVSARSARGTAARADDASEPI